MRRWLSIFVLLVTPLLFPLITSGISHNNDVSELVNSHLPPTPIEQDVALVAALDGTVYLVDTNSMEVRWSFSSGLPIYSSYQASVNNDEDRHNASELSSDLYYVDCGDDWELMCTASALGSCKNSQ